MMLDSNLRDELVGLVERAQVSALHRVLDRVWQLGYDTGRKMDTHTRFTEDALRSQDGKKVPLTQGPGGPAIGEATLRYDPDLGALVADMKVENPNFAELFPESTSAVIFRQGE